MEAYSALWATTKNATPTRKLTGPGPLTAEERSKLYDDLTQWYYAEGHGMVLSEATRNIYLTAKENLICEVRRLQPESLRERVLALDDIAKHESVRGDASIRQLSLLRTSIRADLLVYTGPWGQRLTKEDRGFLAACGISQWRRPWRRSLRKRRAVEEGEPSLAAAPAEEPPAATEPPAPRGG